VGISLLSLHVFLPLEGILTVFHTWNQTLDFLSQTCSHAFHLSEATTLWAVVQVTTLVVILGSFLPISPLFQSVPSSCLFSLKYFSNGSTYLCLISYLDYGKSLMFHSCHLLSI
jgi:hypothetical protein